MKTARPGTPAHRPASRKRARTARAFSLLELTLVLVIIGALMAMAAVNLLGGASRAKIKTTKASMQTIASQLKTYYIEQNAYPPTLEVLVTGKFLEAKSLKDSFDGSYYYKTPGRNNNPYDLISSGEDKQLGSADDLDVWTMDTAAK